MRQIIIGDVHGYFEPNIPLNRQQEDLIIGTLKGDLYLKKNINARGTNYLMRINR